MIYSILETITSFVINLISTFGYFGVFAAMAIESASIPLPSEIIMPFSGFLVTQGKFNFWLLVLVGAAGNLFGSWVMYFLGYWGQEVVVRRLIRAWGKYVLVSEKELDQAEKWFNRFGSWIIFFSRILPVVRTFISVPAGIAKIDIVRFSILTFLGSFIWSAVLAYIGVVLGENWRNIEPLFRRFDILVAIFIIILIGFFLYHKSKEFSKP
ncbi:MAG: DedA family protein [Candidatus Woykebacteria bacterium]